MNLIGKYYVDENGNKWDKEKFLKREAKDYSQTLGGCTECIDCVNCTHCKNCISCESCHHCLACNSCLKCRYCVGCRDCISIERKILKKERMG